MILSSYFVLEQLENFKTTMYKVGNGISSATDYTTLVIKVVKSGNIATSGIKDFIGDVGKELGKFGSLLGAFGSMTGIWGTSVEVKKLDEIISTLGTGFKRIEDRFDKVEDRIKEAEKAIKSALHEMDFWGRVKGPLRKLRIAKNNVKNYMQASSPASRKTRRNDLDKTLYKSIKSSIKIIVDEFKGENLLKEKLCNAVQKFAQEDRKIAVTVMMRIFNAVAIGASHLNMVGTLLKRGDIEDTTKDMVGYLRIVFKEIKECDEDIVQKAKTKWLKDLKSEILDTKGGKEFKRASRRVRKGIDSMSLKEKCL